jgi:hypothetical protein
MPMLNAAELAALWWKKAKIGREFVTDTCERKISFAATVEFITTTRVFPNWI